MTFLTIDQKGTKDKDKDIESDLVTQCHSGLFLTHNALKYHGPSTSWRFGLVLYLFFQIEVSKNA